MKRITINQQESLEDIIKAKRKSKNGLYTIRLSVVELIYKNPNIRVQDICKELSIDRKSVFRWVKIYNKDGKEGLEKIKMGSRPKGTYTYSKEIFEALTKEIDKQDRYWSGAIMQEWILDNFKIEIPEGTIRERVKSEGYSYKLGRTIPHKTNRDEKGRFKKVV